MEKRENPVCHFVTPLDGSIDLDVHRPAEVITETSYHCLVCKLQQKLIPILLFCLQVIATEGKCWKRRIEIVIREYHKWRTYFKKRVSFFFSGSGAFPAMSPINSIPMKLANIFY